MVNLEVVGENLRWYLHIYINNKSYCLSKDNPSFNIELPQGKHTMVVIGTKMKDLFEYLRVQLNLDYISDLTLNENKLVYIVFLIKE